MARTKASVGAKVAAVKSSKARCSVAAPPTPGTSGTSDRSSRGNSGGNSVCPRETPKWQKPITRFFISKDTASKDSDYDSEGSDTTTKSKPKRNVIHSDDENETSPPKNTVLDETIELEPLTGENSHKIDEYYSKNEENNNAEKNNEGNNSGENNNGEKDSKVKGKGVGKKTKGKENLSDNVDRKRDREEDLEENTSKRVKVA